MVAGNCAVVLFSLRGPLTPDYQLFVLPSYRNNRTSACVTVQQLCRMGWLTEVRCFCILFWSPSIASHWIFGTEAKPFNPPDSVSVKVFRIVSVDLPFPRRRLTSLALRRFWMPMGLKCSPCLSYGTRRTFALVRETRNACRFLFREVLGKLSIEVESIVVVRIWCSEKWSGLKGKAENEWQWP